VLARQALVAPTRGVLLRPPQLQLLMPAILQQSIEISN